MEVTDLKTYREAKEYLAMKNKVYPGRSTVMEIYEFMATGNEQLIIDNNEADHLYPSIRNQCSKQISLK